jgi:ferredoxin
MHVKVNTEACIGCGSCQAIAPNVFEMGDDGYAIAKVEKVNSDDKEEAIEAMESCPTGAIEVEE